MDSAEKWKQFAEQLQAKQAELQEQLAGVQAELQASQGLVAPAAAGMGACFAGPTTSQCVQRQLLSPVVQHPTNPSPNPAVLLPCRPHSRAWKWLRRRAMTWTCAPLRCGSGMCWMCVGSVLLSSAFLCGVGMLELSIEASWGSALTCLASPALLTGGG